MTRRFRLALSGLSALLLSVLLAACAVPKGETPGMFDLGPLRPLQEAGTLPALPPIAVADVSVPTWLDRPLMFYRLNYANDQQPQPYAHNRWSMPPAQLLTQRVKARIAQAGGAALSAADGATGVPVLRIDADDFSQFFSTPGQSAGQVALRVSVFNSRTLLGQKTFIRQVPSPSADADGGARALAQASDAAIADMMKWLATLPLK